MNQKYCGFRVKSAEWVLSLFSLSVGLVIIFSPPDFCVCDNTLHLLYLLSVAKYKYSHSTLHQSPRCRFPKSPARAARTYTQRTLMQPHANTQTCPTLHLFTFYYLRPSLSSILPSPVCPSFSSFFSRPHNADKANKESCGEMGQRYGLIWAQRHLQTWSREEVRWEEGGERKEG